MHQKSKKPFDVVLREDGVLEIIDPNYREPTPEEIARKRKISAQCGHIKRRLNQDEPLTGELLELALDVLGDGDFSNEGELSTVDKLNAGQPLNDYEHHLMVDVFLLHTRLGA